MTFLEWCHRWALPQQAIDELIATCVQVTSPQSGELESPVSDRIRLKVARTALLPWGQQKILWRNNRGAGQLKNGSFVRWGLANDSEKLGARVKSGDHIGGEQILITPAMVGSVMLRFWSVEVKRSNWTHPSSALEYAQVQWASIVNALGGRAIITNSEETV